jgi:hypothetical protein
MKIHYKLIGEWERTACNNTLFPNWTIDPRKVTCLDCKRSQSWQYAMEELDYQDEMDMYEDLRRGL